MVIVAQLVRASDCGSEGRGFEPHQSPRKIPRPLGDFFIAPFALSARGILWQTVC